MQHLVLPSRQSMKDAIQTLLLQSLWPVSGSELLLEQPTLPVQPRWIGRLPLPLQLAARTRYKDLDGYTTAPEIAPPISRHVDRDSGVFGVASFDYGSCEIASEVGWDTYKTVADEICRTFADTNLFHGYTYNTWSDVITYDNDFINDWFESPQTSIYYSLQVNPDTLRKDDAASLLEGDDYADLFGFDAEDDPLLCSSCAE